jgi:DNA-binding CsgD family transcriptional regulator
MSNHRGTFDGQLEPLTSRETEVLRLMAEGASSREIAARLGISYATVRSHIRSMGGKLDVHSKGEAVSKARTLQIIA